MGKAAHPDELIFYAPTLLRPAGQRRRNRLVNLQIIKMIRASIEAGNLIYKAQFFMSILTPPKLSGIHQINRRDGLVVRASASQSVDLGFIP